MSNFEFSKEALEYVVKVGERIWGAWEKKFLVADYYGLANLKSVFLSGFSEGYLTRVTQEREKMLDDKTPKDLIT